MVVKPSSGGTLASAPDRTSYDLPANNVPLQTALAAKATIPVAGTTISASRDLSSADLGKRFLVDTSGGAVVLNVPTGVFAAGAQQAIFFKRSGSNGLTFTATGTTMDNPDSVLASNGATVALTNHPTIANRFEVVG